MQADSEIKSAAKREAIVQNWKPTQEQCKSWEECGYFIAKQVIDESLLRRHERLPGNIYRGDTAERGERFKGVERALFLNPSIWEPNRMSAFVSRGIVSVARVTKPV